MGLNSVGMCCMQSLRALELYNAIVPHKVLCGSNDKRITER